MNELRIKCTNEECEGEAEYNGFISRPEKVRYYKCKICGKVTTIRLRDMKVLKEKEWIYGNEEVIR